MNPHKKRKRNISLIESHPFSKKLIHWYTERKRDLPWRNTKDPYRVWLSEIILQQTRVDQGLPYYERFVEAFPTINDLASAEEEDVLRLWQGLGYYSRARNLHHTAKFVAYELGGVFPTTYNRILELKGIGPYTAAAIASICFEEPRPVVDGNVFRFASRYFVIEDDIMKSSTRKKFERILGEVIPSQNPGEFNQAMMEFGATVCSPNPKCKECIFLVECLGKNQGKEKDLPIKKSKVKVRHRVFNYMVFTDGKHLLMRRRDKNDVWAHLYDFPLYEGEMSEDELFFELNKTAPSFSIDEISRPYQHILSHQKIEAKFYKVLLKESQLNEMKGSLNSEVYSEEEIVTLPKPKLIVNYLQELGIKS